MKAEDVAGLRRDYEDTGLNEEDVADNPMAQFAVWFSQAASSGIHEPNAFVLATVGAGGQPSARAVLMKEYSDTSLVLYTNLESQKSLEMRENPNVSATFVWLPLHRQVRLSGVAAEVPGEMSDAYFSTRPRGAQIAAHASRQSRLVERREVLEARFRELDASLGDAVPRPDSWGGWEITPQMVEFWQGRPNRFHDRLRYRATASGWDLERLQP